jgi:ATP synthase protein I
MMTTAALGPQALGAIVGLVVVAGFFAFGTLTMSLVSRVAPTASLLVALLTYVLQVLVLGLLFVGLTRSGATEQALDPRWLGGAVIGSTLAWTVWLVVREVRTRRPIYDLPLPDAVSRR